jgi:hypothetical protein
MADRTVQRLVPGGVLLVGAVADLQVVELVRGIPRCLPPPEVMHAVRTGQGWHWALVKRAMSGAASAEDAG